MSSPSRKSPYHFLPVFNRDKRGGAVAHIQDVIRGAIVRLELAPGEFIDKAALCARLGVSRFPVSEALGRLADEGFVEVLPQRGTRVTRIDLDDCREAMFIRRALEADAMREIALRAHNTLFDTLQTILVGQRDAMKADDRVRFHELDLAFHESLLDELGYERVKVAVAAARAKLDRMRLFMCTPARQAATYTEHKAIVAALAKRDANASAAAMVAHLDIVMAELATLALQHPDAFADGTSEPEAA